jgi:hypothetical protein
MLVIVSGRRASESSLIQDLAGCLVQGRTGAADLVDRVAPHHDRDFAAVETVLHEVDRLEQTVHVHFADCVNVPHDPAW